MTIFLNRHTGFNRSCRVRFNIRVAEGIESGIRDEVSDQDGKSLGEGQLILDHNFFLTKFFLKDNALTVMELVGTPKNCYVYVLGVSPSLVSRYCEGYSFWSI